MIVVASSSSDLNDLIIDGLLELKLGVGVRLIELCDLILRLFI